MQPTSQKPAVAVFDGESPPALAFTRALGRAGVHVHVYSHLPFASTRFSKHCTSFTLCPPPEQTDLFLPWVQKHLKAPLYIAPTSDVMVFYLTQYPGFFPPQPTHSLAPPQAVLDVLLKNRFESLCHTLGVPTPQTFFFASQQEAWDMAHTLPYPLVIKPTSHVGVGGVRGVVIYNPEQLREHYTAYPAPPHTSSVFRAFPSLHWPLLQKYVPGALEGMYSISGILDPHGHPLSYSSSCKKMQWPPKLGVGTLFEPWEEKTACQEGLRLASACLKRGMFELELLWDKEQQRYMAIDLNPRGHGFMSFDIARNNNTPLLWYRMACGQPLTAHMSSKPSAARWVHGVPYHVGNMAHILRGPQRFEKTRAYLKGFSRRTVGIVHDSQDPGPTFPHVLQMFKHPGGLIKPFFQNQF
jgi:D-aspartate ligase